MVSLTCFSTDGIKHTTATMTESSAITRVNNNKIIFNDTYPRLGLCLPLEEGKKIVHHSQAGCN